MDKEAYQIPNPLYNMYRSLVKEYGTAHAEMLTLWEIQIEYADLVNQKIYANPQFDKSGKQKPTIYPYLKA